LIKPTESSRVIAEASEWNDGPPDVVWCCSGSCHPSLYIDTPIDQIQHMMDSNYFSSAYMAHAILNAWIRSGTKGSDPRHLIFTSSFIALYTFTGFTPYSPSKAALRSLSDSLSQEMNLYAGANPAERPIRIHICFPGTMFTEGLEAENSVKTDVTHMLEEGEEGQTAEAAALQCIKGLERGEELVVTTFLTRLVMTASLGGSTRGGFFKGLFDIFLSWVVVIVMVFVRWDMDSKVKKWGKKHGSSGMKQA
jgi:3-dehydrosphinganine reductase